jgi:hypothetical protein
VIVRSGPPSAHALALAGVAALLLIGAGSVSPDAPPLALFACPLKAATGIPCLGCGATHAFHFAARGHLVLAFLASPLAALAAIGCAVHVAWTALRLVGLPVAPRIAMTPKLRWAAAGALVANWLFVLLRGRA